MKYLFDRYFLGKMDGIEMAVEIKKIDQNTNIIIISAHNEIGFIQKTEEIGIYTYLYKPIDLPILVDTLLEVIKEMQESQVIEYESL